MAILPLQLGRVSNYLRSTLSLNTINGTQANLLNLENQLSTGVRLNAPSEDPGNAQIAIQLQRALERRTAYSDAMNDANSRLSMMDSTLGDVTDVLQQVQSLASANVGSDVTADQRESAAAVVQSIYSQLLTLSNRQLNGQYLFAGDKGSTAPYVEAGGGVKFVGSSATLKNLVDDATPLDITIDGTQVFGGDSSAVHGVDLVPNLTGSTRLKDVRGATGSGIRAGAISISNGTTTRSIDLSKADTAQDVVDAINASGLATATIAGQGFSLVATSGALTVSEVGGNYTASDLGIATGATASATVTGASIDPKLTTFTPVAALFSGAGANLAGGLKISNGAASFNVSFTGATTVQDVLNAINTSGSGALARINAAGNGIDIANVTQGTALSISENGGTAASTLGLRTLTTSTPIAGLNDGRGVQTATGPDLEIRDKNGVSHMIDIDGSVTILDVINKINAGGGGAITASFASNTNGIRISDATGGSQQLIVRSANFSSAAVDLGIAGTVPGAVIQGTDVNPTRASGVFDDLLQLAAALHSNDQFAITKAAAGITDSLATVVKARAVNGARLKELGTRQDALQDQNLATQSVLSDIKDTDYPATIAKYQLLQTTLQATYAVTSRSASQSLLDFLK